jgi:uncharacterized coiled-coil protein SlyX
MTQAVKITAGVFVVIMLFLIVSAMVWTAAMVSQLTKDKDRLDMATQKLDERADALADKVKSLEGRNIDVAKDIGDVRRDHDDLDEEVGEFILATGHQLSDVKRVIVEQDIQLDARINSVEQQNAEYKEKIEELSRRLPSQKKSVSASDSSSRPAKKTSGQVFVDVNNPGGTVGWDKQYTVQLRAVVADQQNFLIDWGVPFAARDISPNKPDIVKKTPKFKYANQLYFFLKLGDAADNRIAGVIDFAPTDKKYFPFDLYVDKDRDGDLAEDFISASDAISSNHQVRGIRVPYKDGTTEEYSMEIYAVQDGEISVWYQPKAGRYGELEANQKRMGILILDTTGNGLFNDAEDVILMDWDFDGGIDGSYQGNGKRGLYSVLELPGVKYRVTEIDEAGRRLTIVQVH